MIPVLPIVGVVYLGLAAYTWYDYKKNFLSKGEKAEAAGNLRSIRSKALDVREKELPLEVRHNLNTIIYQLNSDIETLRVRNVRRSDMEIAAEAHREAEDWVNTLYFSFSEFSVCPVSFDNVRKI